MSSGKRIKQLTVKISNRNDSHHDLFNFYFMLDYNFIIPYIYIVS